VILVANSCEQRSGREPGQVLEVFDPSRRVLVAEPRLMASIAAFLSSFVVTIWVIPFAAAQCVDASFTASASPRPR
jgi:hypothetical protein